MLNKKFLFLICFSVLSCCSKQQKQEDIESTPSPSVVSTTSFSPAITEPTTEESEVIFTNKIYLPRTEETKEGAREVTDCLIKDVTYELNIHGSVPYYYDDLKISSNLEGVHFVPGLEWDNHAFIRYYFFFKVPVTYQNFTIEISHKDYYTSLVFDVVQNPIVYSTISSELCRAYRGNKNLYFFDSFNSYTSTYMETGVRSIGINESYFDTNNLILVACRKSPTCSSVLTNSVFMLENDLFVQLETIYESDDGWGIISKCFVLWIQIPKGLGNNTTMLNEYAFYESRLL